MKTDKELLILAAKAVGLHVKATAVNTDDDFTGVIIGARHTKQKIIWNPISVAGDALQLAVHLDMGTFFHDDGVKVFFKASGITDFIVEPYGSDKHAATRRAIVRAAAAIGEPME